MKKIPGFLLGLYLMAGCEMAVYYLSIIGYLGLKWLLVYNYSFFCPFKPDIFIPLPEEDTI